MPDTDTLEGMTSEQMKQRLKETSVIDSEETEELAEAETVAEETEEEVTSEGTPTGETEKETKSPEESEPRFKIKRRGKEEELPLSKLIQRAQLTESLQEKLQKEREEREKEREILEKRTTVTSPEPPFEKMNEWFLKNVNENPASTILGIVEYGIQQREQAFKKEISDEKAFVKKTKSEYKEWDDIKDIYQDFRDEGKSRDAALASALADYYRNLAIRATEEATKKGEEKGKRKLQAQLPVGEKRLKSKAELPSPEEARNMTSAELRKYLKYHRHEDW